MLEDSSIDAIQNTGGGYYGGATSPGSGTEFGEVRLVYGVTDAGGEPLKPDFTMIFEYGLPRDVQVRTTSLSDYAASWHALGEFEEFDHDYLTALLDILLGSTAAVPPSREGRTQTRQLLSLNEASPGQALSPRARLLLRRSGVSSKCCFIESAASGGELDP